MKFLNLNLSAILFASVLLLGFSSCGDDDVELKTKTYNYAFNTGQVAPTFAYTGNHSTDLSASITLNELSNGNTEITVAIQNSMDGETYRVHAHDMADATTTTNGTPYNETPNATVFASPLTGNGGTVTETNTSTMTFDEISTSYDGFFVIHDPLQAISTVDPTTYVILGVFAR